jgi:hypothetical protein
MSGKRLLARTGLAAILGVLIFLAISTIESHATPIKPDVQKLIRQSQQTSKPFIPARAGWSEPATSTTLVRNPVLESIADDHLRQEFRETLSSVAIPDPWIVLALATLILLMRKLRSIEAKRNRALQPVFVAEPANAQSRLAA